jgi:hypothetical protein
MSVSFHPADLTTTTNTIFEEGDSTDSVVRQLESGEVSAYSLNCSHLTFRATAMPTIKISRPS